MPLNREFFCEKDAPSFTPNWVRVSMPLRWDEVKRARGLEFGPEEALARLHEVGDLWKPMAQPNVGRASARHRQAEACRHRGLPKPRSQSGRRLFIMTGTERFGDGYQGESDIDPKYYRGEVPRGWETGSNEVIEGSFERGSLEIWLKGKKRPLRVP